MSSTTTEVETVTETDWAQDLISMRLNTLINVLADRDDLILKCDWNKKKLKGQPSASAWFTPATSVVTIRMHDAIGDTPPEMVNVLRPEGRRAHPHLMGLVCHEASHAHSTFHDPTIEATKKAWRIATLLEEPRIERRHLERRPQDRLYLRASSLLIDVKPITEPKTPEEAVTFNKWSAAGCSILSVARMLAGVLEESDMRELLPMIKDALGDDYDAVVDILSEAINLEDADVAGLVGCAQKLIDLLGDPPKMSKPECGHSSEKQPGGGGGEPGESDDDGDEDDEDGEGSGELENPFADSLQEALEHMLEEVAAEAAGELQEKEDTSAADAQVAKAKQEEADTKKQEADKPQAKKVFTGHGASNSGSNCHGTPRPPTDEERRLSNQIAATLRKAQFRDRTHTKRSTEMPPGRVNGRDAMLGAAQRSMGQVVTARPFKSVVHRHVPEPPLTVGVMCDVSGSMGWSTDVMATTAWAFSQAVNSIHGNSATVTFGRDVKSVVAPGVPPVMVTPFEANDGWENFKDGFSAIDGALNLTRGRGVRILVVVSDGHYGGDGQAAAARDAVQRMKRNGGYVLWVSLNGGWSTPIIPSGAISVSTDAGNVAGLPAVLTAALSSALRSA